LAARLLEQVPTTAEHIHRVARGMREEERLEVEALCGESPLQALLRSRRESRVVFTCLDAQGQPVCIWGVSGPDADGYYCPWLLGTRRVPQNGIAFLRSCRAYLPAVLELYPRLRNWIDARYTQSLDWIRWLGFDVSAPRPVGRNGALFCEVIFDGRKCADDRTFGGLGHRPGRRVVQKQQGSGGSP